MAASIGKSRTERACAISWYSNWSLEQRNAFIDKLLEKSSLDLATESLLNDLQNMSFGSINGYV